MATTPTRHGYSFVGWDKLDENGVGDGKVDALSSTVPAENASYIALWKSADTTYTVVYWLQNAAGTEYDYMGSQKRPAVAGEVVSGDASWLKADSYICGLTDTPTAKAASRSFSAIPSMKKPMRTSPLRATAPPR